MSLRLFLSAVNENHRALRERLAERLRPGGFVIVQEREFVEVGRTTLVKLALFIEKETDGVLHLVGAKVGSVPSMAEADDLLRHIGVAPLRQRFSGLFEGDAFRRLTYTQWEAWLGLFYQKHVIVYQTEDAAGAGEPSGALPMPAGEHLGLLKPFGGYPVTFRDDDDLVGDKLLPPLTRILNWGTPHEKRPWHVPYSALGELFIGRDDFLSDLRRRFDEARAAGRWPKHAICGVGGIGKTRVVVEYAIQHRDAYSAVLMVNGDSPESLRRELASVANQFDSSLDPAAPEELRERVTLDSLQKNPGWLLIIDNADTQAARDEVARRLPQWSNGHLLITARFAVWPRSVETLELHVLSVEDAARFLLKATDGHRRVTPDDAGDARKLAENDLDCLCLALGQAAAYIAKRNISFAEYRRRWKENEKEARTWADSVVMEYHHDGKSSLSVATTWLTTFRELTPAARTLLEMLAWLAPAPIPRGLFDEPELQTELQAASDEPEADVELALAELRQYLLVSHSMDEPADSAGRVHRVIQLITRQRLTDSQIQFALTSMLYVIDAATPTDLDNVHVWSVLEPLRPHLSAIVSFADKAGVCEPTTRLMNQLATILLVKALYGEAEPLMRRALELDEQCNGSDHPIVAVRLHNLAQLLQETNRLSEAEPFMRRVLAINLQTYGADHPSVARSLSSLAQLLQETNRLAEAEPLMRRALAIDQHSYGAHDPNVARDLNNLALLLKDTNRLVEAEKLMRQAIAITKHHYGAEHRHVAGCLNNLAQLLQATMRFAEAESLMVDTLAVDERFYGDNHPKVASDLVNLAALFQATNRLAVAEPLMRRALAIDEQFYGNQHPTVAVNLSNLASLLQAMGRFAEAEPLMRQALDIFEKSLIPDHPNIASALNNLARLLEDTNRLSEAEPLMRRNIAILFRTSRYTGYVHANLQAAFFNYVELLKAMGRSDAEVDAALRRVKEE